MVMMMSSTQLISFNLSRLVCFSLIYSMCIIEIGNYLSKYI